MLRDVTSCCGITPPEEAGPPAGSGSAAGSCCLSADYRSAAVLGRLITRRRQHGRLLTAGRPEWRSIENIDGEDQENLPLLSKLKAGGFSEVGGSNRAKLWRLFRTDTSSTQREHQTTTAVKTVSSSAVEGFFTVSHAYFIPMKRTRAPSNAPVLEDVLLIRIRIASQKTTTKKELM